MLNLLWMIIIGFIAGALAKLLMPGMRPETPAARQTLSRPGNS
ncbi:MAG: hypothetical protein QM330_11295 [Acidobacteriota bacterium]|nr:hypothetical protein [Acidobacteriota bacterium]